MISRDVIYYGLIKGLNVLYWLIVLKLSSLYLDPISFGNFSIVFNISIYLAIILTGWQSSSALRFYHDIENKYDYYNILLKTIVRSFIYFLGFGIALCLLFYLYDKDTSKNILMILPLSIAFGLHQLIVSICRIKRDLKFYLRLIIIQGVTLLSLVIPFIMLLGWVGLMFSFTISYLVVVFYFMIMKRNQLFLVWKENINKPLVKKMTSYGLPIVMIGAFSQLLSSMDQILLKHYGYHHEVGIYAANYNLSEKSVFAFLAIFISAFTPILYKKINKENFNLLSQIKKGLFQFLLVAIPVVIILSLFSKKISYLLLDEKYVEGHWIIPVIAVAGIFVGIASFYSEVLTVSKKTKTLAMLYGLAALVNGIVNLIFIPTYGLKAAVGATFISYVVLALIIYIASRRQLKLNFIEIE